MPYGAGGPGRSAARTAGAAAGPKRGRFKRRKVSVLTINKIGHVDYKNVGLLRQFTDERGGRATQVCGLHGAEGDRRAGEHC